MLRAQDILVLLKLASGGNVPWRQQDLAVALKLSQAEIHNTLRRSALAGLFEPESRRVQRQALLEFLVHGLKYVFPAQLGGRARGVPTAWAAEPLVHKLVAGDDDDRPVWAHADGKIRGASIEPLYKTAPEASLSDPKLHELLALVDAIRVGRARERKLAADLLKERLSQ